MTPTDFADRLRQLPPADRAGALLAYFADDSQWVRQTQGTLRWGWFTGPTPSELAQLALD
jgi:hypothetical protein